MIFLPFVIPMKHNETPQPIIARNRNVDARLTAPFFRPALLQKRATGPRSTKAAFNTLQHKDIP